MDISHQKILRIIKASNWHLRMCKNLIKKNPGCEIQDISTSISIKVEIEEMSPQDDESDKHLEARDRRYSCLKWE